MGEERSDGAIQLGIQLRALRYTLTSVMELARLQDETDEELQALCVEIGGLQNLKVDFGKLADFLQGGLLAGQSLTPEHSPTAPRRALPKGYTDKGATLLAGNAALLTAFEEDAEDDEDDEDGAETPLYTGAHLDVTHSPLMAINGAEEDEDEDDAEDDAEEGKDDVVSLAGEAGFGEAFKAPGAGAGGAAAKKKKTGWHMSKPTAFARGMATGAAMRGMATGSAGKYAHHANRKSPHGFATLPAAGTVIAGKVGVGDRNRSVDSIVREKNLMSLQAPQANVRATMMPHAQRYDRQSRATMQGNGGTGAMPKRSSTIKWKGGSDPRFNPEAAQMQVQAEMTKLGMEEIFKARVSKAFADHAKPVRLSDVDGIMEALGRDVPDKVFDRTLESFQPRLKLPDSELDEATLVRLVWSIETTRRKMVLHNSRLHSQDLMHMGESEEFVRVVGDQLGWFGHPLLLPDNEYVQYFDVAIMFILIFVFVTLPLCLAFEPTNRQLYATNLLCDLIFFVDILKNFTTGYVNEQKMIIVQRDKVVRNYLRTWFFIDLLSCFPITEIIELAGSGGDNSMLSGKKALKMLRLIRMTKLIKLLRASQLVNKVRHQWVVTMEYYKIHISDSLIKLLRLLMMMLTLAHWGSCILFLLLRTYSYPRQSWAVLWGLVSATEGKMTYSVGHAYSWGVYKVLLLVVGQAFQEFPSAQICVSTNGWCLIESWMTLVGTFIGSFFNAAVVSTITAIIVNSNVSTQEFEEQLLRTNEYMRSLHLPTELRDRIRDYYFHRWNEGKIFDESLILERLNPELCTEILFYKIRELIPKVPMLRTASRRFSEVLAKKMDPQVFIEGDAVFVEGESGEVMYFIDKGLAEILVSAVANEVVRLIADGCFFGEAACILRCRRTATIRSKSIISVYGIHRDTIEPSLADYPEVGDYLVRLAHARVNRIQQLHVNSRLTGGQDIVDSVDEEDMRTPLFESATKSWNGTIKYNPGKEGGGRGGILVRQSVWARKKSRVVAAYGDQDLTGAKERKRTEARAEAKQHTAGDRPQPKNTANMDAEIHRVRKKGTIINR